MAMAKTRDERIMFLAVIVIVCLDGVVGAKTSILKDDEIEKHLKRLNKPAVKTIKSDAGDIIDCIDIYKQPAFDHPSLKNHKIQMRPTGYPIGSGKNVSGVPQKPKWRKSGSCPQGTVPIRRTQKSDLLRAISPESYGKSKYSYNALNNGVLEYALMTVEGGEYYGSKAEINVWKIHVEPKEFSASKISVVSSNAQDASSIQAGWMVHPALFGDNKTRLFTYWTADGFNKTGCYNLFCPGFIQVSQKIFLGAEITPVSTYNGKQYSIQLLVYKDPKTGNWWLVYGRDNELLGYWPTSLFKDLNKATLVAWGGEIINIANGGRHTTTQMGSGLLPSEGPGKSSYFDSVLVVDKSNNLKAPEGAATFSKKPQCYDIAGSNTGKNMGYSFYYGGPGFGPNCL